MERIQACESQGILFVARHRQQRIAPQLRVIVDILVAQGQPEEALRQHCRTE